MTAMLRKDFDEFLFAPVGNDSDGTPVTLLTVLARLDVDPWEEAADLSHLSREPAMQRLASRLEAMPNGPVSAADTVNIATRLITLLHRAPARKPSAPTPTPGPGPTPTPTPLPELKVAGRSKGFKLAIYCLIGMLAVLVGQWALAPRDTPVPMDTTIAPDGRR
jgi:hypothetical protein